MLASRGGHDADRIPFVAGVAYGNTFFVRDHTWSPCSAAAPLRPNIALHMLR